MSKTLLLDAHLSSKTLVAGLRARGRSVSTLKDLGLPGNTLDADVAKSAGEKLGLGRFVLVTIDVTIVEDSPRFGWGRYAIAWIKPNPNLSGADVEAAKHDILHNHVDKMAEQGPGDHFTYAGRRCYRHPPSLMSRPY